MHFKWIYYSVKVNFIHFKWILKEEKHMAETRTVIMDEKAVQRAETFIEKTKNEKGIRLTIGNVFAMALDKMLDTENG